MPRENNYLHPDSRASSIELALAIIACVVLFLVGILAFFTPEIKPSDQLTLLVLGATFLVASRTRLYELVVSRNDVTTFFLMMGMFVIYAIARKAGPETGYSIRFAALPDDEFVIPYSAYFVVVGALITGPLRWKKQNDFLRATISAIVIIASLGVFSFILMHRFYPAGPTKMLDPSPLPYLGMFLIEYGCVALLCHVATSHHTTRRLVVNTFPLLLLALWFRFLYISSPSESG